MMRQSVYLIFFCFVIISCSQSNSQQENLNKPTDNEQIISSSESPNDTSQTTQDSIPKANLDSVYVFIDDESKYDTAFVACIKKGARGSVMHADSITLKNNKVIFTSKSYGGAVRFPIYVPTDHFVTYQDSSSSYSLALKRINLTTLEYQLTSKNEQIRDTTLQGKVYLGCHFWIASETYVDENGMGYGAYEYTGDGVTIGMDSTRARIWFYQRGF